MFISPWDWTLLLWLASVYNTDGHRNSPPPNIPWQSKQSVLLFSWQWLCKLVTSGMWCHVIQYRKKVNDTTFNFMLYSVNGEISDCHIYALVFICPSVTAIPSPGPSKVHLCVLGIWNTIFFLFLLIRYFHLKSLICLWQEHFTLNIIIKTTRFY